MLETDRLRLRPLNLSDVSALHPIFANPEAMRLWHTPPHADEAETRQMIERLLAGPGRRWVMVEREGQDAIGLVEYLGNPGPPGLGYILAPSHWGRGLVSEAVKAVLDHGFAAMGLDRVELWIDEANLRSRRLAGRLGFMRRGAFRQRYRHRTSPHLTLVYGLTREEHDEAPAAGGGTLTADAIVPVLAVADVGRSLAFYRDRLGCRVIFAMGDPPHVAEVSFSAWSGGPRLRLVRRAEGAAAASLELVIEVGEDLTRLRDRCEAAGLEGIRAPETKPWGMRVLSVNDPDGFILNFTTPA